MSIQNPYWGTNFFEFFQVLGMRVWEFLSGGFRSMDLAADELQLLVLALIALSCAPVGTFLVLKRQTMLVNSLSHTMLAGIVLAVFAERAISGSGSDSASFFPSDTLLIAAAFVMALVTSFLTQSCVRYFKVGEDASTGIVFTFLFAVGIILVSALSKNAHMGVELVMGNADALQPSDLTFIWWICTANAVGVFLFWRPLFITTFDPVFAQVNGISNTLFSYFLMMLVAVSTVGAFRAVGVLMVLAFFVTPVLIARLWTHRLHKLLALACFIGVATATMAVALARHLLSVHSLACSTSGLAVSCLFVVYCLCLLPLRYRT